MGDAEVGEKVSQLLVGQAVEQALRHQASRANAVRLYLRLLDHRVASVDAAQDQQPVGLVGQKSAEPPAVPRLHLHVLVALANLPAWVEDGGQQGVEIGPLVGGEIGADVAALVE